jgi:anti-anti-sigma factor
MATYFAESGKLVCSFSGQIDTETTLSVEEELFEKINENEGSVVFDLKEVDYIASSFLRVCLRAAKMMGKDRFVIIQVAPPVKKVFKIAGFDKIMNIE